MIRKRNQIDNIRVERICLFSQESLEINALNIDDIDEGELSWIYILEGELFMESAKSKNLTSFVTNNKLNDLRAFSEGFIKITAGITGCACLLIFSSKCCCSVKNLKDTNIISSDTSISYILPLVKNLEFTNSDKPLSTKNIVILPKGKSVKFKNLDNNSHHILLINT
jgi:hypothetical protein